MEQKQKQLIVAKIGTSSLTTPDGSLAPEKIANLVRQIGILKDQGHGVVLVTSGSIAAGFRRLGYQQRPSSIGAKQAAAAVGQGLLMEEYTRCLLERGYVGAQILLTREDFTDRRRYRNAFQALDVLLKRGAVPIINENDTISIEELKFGDNDTLSAQVAGLVHGDLLVLLTDIDGLYTADPRKDPGARRIDHVSQITPELEALAGSAGSYVGTGGMRSKLNGAKLAVMAGVPVCIGSSYEENSLIKAVAGTAKGTYFQACRSNLPTKLQWMAFHSSAKGTLWVDGGAAAALEERGKSLLPSGIMAVAGDFAAGDVVEVFEGDNRYLGKGICNYSAEELSRLLGLSSRDIQKLVESHKIEAIHRDNWLSHHKLQKRRALDE